MGMFAAITSCVGSVTPIPLLLEFDALGMDPDTGEMLGVKKGVGVLQEGRATSIWLDDYEGPYREFLINEPGWSGGRDVRNQIKQSNNFTDAAWVKLEQGTGTIDPLEAGQEVCPTGLSSTRFKAHLNGGTTAADHARIIGYLVNSPGVAGKSYGGSIWVKSNTGANQNILFTSHSTTTQQIVQEVTPTWQRPSFPTFGASATTGYLIVALYGDQTDQDCDILISSSQLEFIDDGESTFVPGEYSDNPNTDITTARVYGTTNGNSVADNIVTEARGTDLPEMPYVAHAPQATNIAFPSIDLTSWAGPMDVAFSASGGVLEGKGFSTLTQTGNAEYQYRRRNFTADAGSPYSAYFIVKDVTQRYVLVSSYNTTDGTFLSAAFDLQLGTSIKNTAGSAFITGPDSNGVCKVGISGDNITYASAFLDIYAADSSGNSLQQGDGVSSFEIHQAQLTKELVASPPIPTEGTAVQRNICSLSFDIANHDDDNGLYYFEVRLP